MKKLISFALCAVMLFTLAACGTKKSEEPAGNEPAVHEWNRTGYFQDADGNFLSVLASELEEYPGWYVGCVLGEDMYGWYIQQEENELRGDIMPEYEEGEFIVTVSEEGEDGVALSTADGTVYHFTPMDLPEAKMSVFINTEGVGQIEYAAEGEELVFDDEYPYTSAQINLAEPTTVTIGAREREKGWYFVKWTLNGEDYTTDEIFTVNVTETCDFVAVFEYDFFAGTYLDEDADMPALEIARGEGGGYDVNLSIFRLTTLDGGVGTEGDDGLLHVTATDANGEPLSYTVEVLGDEATVTITDSKWDLLENGTTFTYRAYDTNYVAVAPPFTVTDFGTGS